jgi:hypothetical protein
VESPAETVIGTIDAPSAIAPTTSDFGVDPAAIVAAVAPPPAATSVEDGIVASGGTIEIGGGTTLTSVSDDLFAEGRYTDFGITLAVDRQAEAGPPADPDEAASEARAPQSTTNADALHDEEEIPPQAGDEILSGSIAPMLSIDLISTFDDAGLR